MNKNSMLDKALFELPGMRAAFSMLVVSAIVQAALIAGQAISLAFVVEALWCGDSVQGQMVGLAVFLICFVSRHGVVFVQDELVDKYACKQAERLHSALLAHAFDVRKSLSKEVGSASLVQLATQCIEDIARYIRVIPPKVACLAGVTFPLLMVLFVLDWVSGVIAFVAFPVIALFMVLLGKQARERAALHYEESGQLSNRFMDTLRGIDTIESLGAFERAAKSVYNASERLRVTTIKTLSVATLSSTVLDLVTVFGIAAMAMMLSFRLMDGSTQLHVALAVLLIAPEFFSPIRSFASEFHASLDGKNALAATLTVVDAPIERSFGDDEPRLDGWRESDVLEAKGLAFTYDDEDSGISDVSFVVEGPIMVGIVGASGAGKTTLLDLIAGFKNPSEGAFALNGRMVNLGEEAWRQFVHYIPQNPSLFHMTLEDNVRLYAPDASRDDVMRVVEIVGLGDLVERLPNGLDTIIGDGGRSLSGGEAQRIALARTLLDDRGVLLFDEPTAHLDIETEFELKQRMLTCMDNRLVFFATHRLHWISAMDTVIVLENGRVAEVGAPSELLSREGALRRFVEVGRGEAVA